MSRNSRGDTTPKPVTAKAETFWFRNEKSFLRYYHDQSTGP